MVNGHCAVFGCKNSNYRLKKWKKELCTFHEGLTHQECTCCQPFSLHRFPSVLLNSARRVEWVKLMRRETENRAAWTPGSSDMVCSEHFFDGKPTLENLDPSLKLGYDKAMPKKRRVFFRQPAAKKACKNTIPEEATAMDEQQINIELNIDETLPEICDPCQDKDAIITSLSDRLNGMTLERNQLQEEVTQLKNDVKREKSIIKPFTWTSLKQDARMKFYTGIQTMAMFNVMFKLIKPSLHGLVFWRGSKHIICKKYRKTDSWRQHKLAQKDQFLLTLMRLRLGLMVEDLADRFCISVGTCSSIFATWIRLLSDLLGNALVVWLPKNVIADNLPKVFMEKHKRTSCIIDCSEVFIERPKSLDVQATTWSDYKKHNTVKFLIAIAPSGYIMYVSDCYGGRASDQFICQDSAFYSHLRSRDEVMADRGFQITEDLLYYNCTLSVPPGARMKSQMTSSECKRTKEVANLRIHVERAINRLKSFKILKNTLAINMLPLIDDIVCTCAALCNIQAPLINDK